MNYKIERDDEPKKVDTIIVYIGLERYRLTESDGDKLVINKMSEGDTDDILISPKCSNQIEISQSMTHLNNYTNDPQNDWEDYKDDFSDNCPGCGSDKKESSHYNIEEDTTTYRCLDCDKFYDI